MMNPNEAQKELASLRRQLAEERDNLRLIRERKSKCVLETEIPLTLTKSDAVRRRLLSWKRRSPKEDKRRSEYQLLLGIWIQ